MTAFQSYTPDIDPREPDEDEQAAAITETMLKIAGRTFADSGHAIRSVHAKSHGLLKATCEVLADLPAPYAQGLFAQRGLHEAVIRFSTVPGDILPDKISTPRGMALKILGVEGARLEGSEADSTQDFIGVNGTTFSTASPKAFHANLKLVAATTDKMEDTKEVISAVMRGVEKVAETFGGHVGLARALGGEPPHHILGETFYTQLPIRYGDNIAKLQFAPATPALKALTGQKIDISAGDDVLRQAVIDFFAVHAAIWELRVQLCTNLDDMPIADPTKEWDETQSPFVRVALLKAPRQIAWSAERSIAVDDGMGFSPWHGIAAHRPLGTFMRLRKMAYSQSQRFRSERNPHPVTEPTSLQDFPA